MKIIDLLVNVANGGKLPKKIKYSNIIFQYNENERTYMIENTEIELFYIANITKYLNDEVEIIEDKEMCHRCGKYPAEYNQTWCEFCLGISEEDKEIQKLSYQQVGYQNCDGGERKIKEVVIDFNKQVKQLGNKLNEVIEVVKELKKEGN